MTQVGKPCTLALTQANAIGPLRPFGVHSTYGRRSAAPPNSAFWSAQLGHQNAP